MIKQLVVHIADQDDETTGPWWSSPLERYVGKDKTDLFIKKKLQCFSPVNHKINVDTCNISLLQQELTDLALMILIICIFGWLLPLRSLSVSVNIISYSPTKHQTLNVKIKLFQFKDKSWHFWIYIKPSSVDWIWS